VKIDELPSVSDALRATPVWATKKFGQHFLLDENLLRRIARAGAPLPDKTVLEIGPGPGGLTRAVLKEGAESVIAVEADQRFAPLLDPLVEASEGRLSLHWGDATKLDPLDGKAPRSVAIVANLPYNVATPLIVGWLSNPAVSHMAVMIQKEVAERVVAEPGSEAYGRLAVMVAATAEARIAFDVSPEAFTPPPKVWSSVVRIDRLESPFEHLEALSSVTRAAFGQRRKMMRSSLKPVFGPDTEVALQHVGLSSDQRAETATPQQFMALAEMLVKRSRPG
jgi:16S rRNA (adenine1518-N6/adenine1519-N6)-dimethyltransferase